MSGSFASRADEHEAAAARRFEPTISGGEAAVGHAHATARVVSAADLPSFEHLRAPSPLAARSAAELDPVARSAALRERAEAEARAIVAEARDNARAMLSHARDAIASERAQAVETGYAEGHAKGVAQADEESAGLVATCERIGMEIAAERARALIEHEADLVHLALAISRRIVNASVDVDETLVIEACRGAMRKAFQRDALQVLAHPDDLELLRAAGPRLAEELGGVHHLEFVEERRLERGGVVVRTPAGEIDATIEGKTSKIEQALREGIEHRRADRHTQGPSATP